MNSTIEIDPSYILPPELRKPEEREVKVIEKSRQCPICHVYYKYGNSYWQHVRYVHASFLSQCVICEKCYKRTTMTKHHILHAHKIAWHLCGNYVRRIKKSDLPQRSENGIKSKTTNLKYFKKKTLHMIREFNCYRCPGSFATIDELFQHVKSHRNEPITESEGEEEEEEVEEDEEWMKEKEKEEKKEKEKEEEEKQEQEVVEEEKKEQEILEEKKEQAVVEEKGEVPEEKQD